VAANYVLINLDTVTPDVQVYPGQSISGLVPFSIVITSGSVDGTVFYTLNGQEPVPGSPYTFSRVPPFQVVINSPGTYQFKYFIRDEVGNRTPTARIVYTTYLAYAATAIAPRAGTTLGGTMIAVSGHGFNPGAFVIIGDQPLPTTFVNHDRLVAKTLPVSEAGTFSIKVDDPINGVSNILDNVYTFIEPSEIVTIADPALQPGEVRKNMFETTTGTMVLTRKMVTNYSIDNVVELRAKALGFNAQIAVNNGNYPERKQVGT